MPRLRGLRPILVGWAACSVLGSALGCARVYRYEETPELQAEGVLRNFLASLAVGDVIAAYSFVAPSTKQYGDPVAYQAASDSLSFIKEVRSTRSEKFLSYALGEKREVRPGRVEIWVSFYGDADIAEVVRIDGRWYVRNPISIIR